MGLTEVKRAKAVYLKTKKYPFTYRVVLHRKVLSQCFGPTHESEIFLYTITSALHLTKNASWFFDESFLLSST